VSLASAEKYLFEGRKNITAKLVNSQIKLNKQISAVKENRMNWTQELQNTLERVSLEAHQAKLDAYSDWSVFYHQHPLIYETDRTQKSEWLHYMNELEKQRISILEELILEYEKHQDSLVQTAITIA